MRRLISLIVVLAVMAAMMVSMAAPAFAAPKSDKSVKRKDMPDCDANVKERVYPCLMGNDVFYG